MNSFSVNVHKAYLILNLDLKCYFRVILSYKKNPLHSQQAPTAETPAP